MKRQPSATCDHGEQTDMPLFVAGDVMVSSGQDDESQALSRVELANVPPKITRAWAQSQ